MSYEVVWPPRTRLRPGESHLRCPVCRKTFIGESEDEYCPPCEQRWRSSHETIKSTVGPPCKECGEPIPLDIHHRPVFCSDRCARNHGIENAMALARAAAEQLNIGESTGWRRKLYEYLAERDGGDCYLCDKHVRLSLVGERHMQGPSVDHVFPRSKGGTDDLDNLALTHLICNIRKGASVLED